MRLLAYCLLTLYSTNAVAVDFLKQGAPAANDGYLFSVKEEQQLRLIDQTNTYNAALNIQLTNQNKVLMDNASLDEQRLSNLKTGFDQSNKDAQEAVESSRWKDFAIFGLGVLAGFFSVYAASKTFHN